MEDNPEITKQRNEHWESKSRMTPYGRLKVKRFYLPTLDLEIEKWTRPT
jgi:hypothetical protein